MPKHTESVGNRIALALCLGILAGATWAQDAQNGLQEVVVTARKRAESAQDIPLSVATFSGESLARLNQATLLSIAGRTPSLQYSEAGGEAQLYVRGVGSNLLAIGADPSVAVNLDGVYLGRPGMGLNQFLDVDRIEILRGPQGTLYGRNATGGALNLISHLPTRDWDGYATVGTGSFSRREFKGAVGGPVADGWTFRVAARREKDDGYVRNLDARGGNLDDNDLSAARAILRFEPSSSLRATTMFDWSEFKSDGQAIRPLDGLGAASLLGAVPTGSLLKERNDLPSFLDWKTYGPTLTIDWDVTSQATLTSISAYRKFNQDFLFNTDGTEIDVTRTTEHFATSQSSQELRLSFRDTGRWNWIGGLYYFKEDKTYELGLVRANLVPSAASPFGKGVFLIPASNSTKAYAEFGELTFKATDTLRLTAGLRYSQEHKDDFNQQINVFANATNPVTEVLKGLYGSFVLPTPASTRAGGKTWKAWTPKFGLDWKPLESTLVYLSYTKGFKSGGYNDNQPSNPVFNPEYVKSYELGVKNDLLGARLRVNAAAFYYDYSDLQVSSFLNSLTLVTNAAQAKVKGLEVDAEARPVPQLDVGLSFTWLDAKYDSFLAPYGACTASVAADPTCAGVALGRPRPIDASGRYLNNAPRQKMTAFAQYDFPLTGAGTFSVFGQVSYTDAVFFNAANDPVARQAGYTLLDARVAYRSSGGHFEIAALGKNLANREYVHNIVQFTSTSNPPSLPGPQGVITDRFAVGNALGYPAPGRTWGLEMTYRY